MKCCDSKTLRVFFVIKLLATILLLAFPQALLLLLYPISIFSPLFAGAVAYADMPSWLMVTFIIIAIASVICLVVFSFCTIINRRSQAGSVILIICYTIEMLAYILSLFGGSFTFGKIVGTIFNAAIVICLCKALGQKDRLTIKSQDPNWQ